jgi:hypothetical protein
VTYYPYPYPPRAPYVAPTLPYPEPPRKKRNRSKVVAIVALSAAVLVALVLAVVGLHSAGNSTPSSSPTTSGVTSSSSATIVPAGRRLGPRLFPDGSVIEAWQK